MNSEQTLAEPTSKRDEAAYKGPNTNECGHVGFVCDSQRVKKTVEEFLHSR